MAYPPDLPLAYKIDHVGIVAPGAEHVFRALHEGLGLPVAWDFDRHGAFRTGGIGLGNLNLELLEPGESLGLPVHEPPAVGLLAFEPATHTTEELRQALAGRGIETPPAMTTGGPVTGFTNVLIPSIGLDVAFFCSYHHPGSRDNAVRRALLESAGGGAIGLRGVTEVRAAVDLDATTAVLGPPTGDARWRFDTGPDLVVDPGIQSGQARLTLAVGDPAAAQAALANAPGLAEIHFEFTNAEPNRPADIAARRRATFTSGT